MSRTHRSRVTVEVPGKPALYNLDTLPGWEIIGTVTDADGTGALVRNQRTGVYCRANAGALRSLPQHKVQAALEALDGA
ncbi:hypothetical protein [Castellaniella sp. UC4442_H9]